MATLRSVILLLLLCMFSPLEAVQNVGRNAIPTYIKCSKWLGMHWFLISNPAGEDFLDSLLPLLQNAVPVMMSTAAA